MKAIFYTPVSCIVLLLLSAQWVTAQAPVFNAVIPNSTAVQKYDKFELTISLTATYTNPYDYSDIAVSCIFIAPGGKKDTVDGFFMQDYTLNTTNGSIMPSGTGNFKVRYAPAETGNWQYVLSCTSASGTTTQSVQTFQAISSAAAGFIKKNNTNYLNFDDGTQYLPIGENMGWYNSNAYTNYTNWVTKLSDNKGNFIRVWMPDWALGLEWKNGSNGFSGLKQYKQSSAYYLDWLLDFSRQKGVYIMLCLNHHGQVSSVTDAEWANNPYNAANGGPCTNTWDFFSNATAKSLIKNRFRYIMARYGYSRNIMCWELFNEVEWTNNFDTYKTAVSSWHGEMAAYLKSKDVYKHLVTTSYAHDNNDPVTWNNPNIDFTQTHYYVGAPNLESILAAGCQDYLSQFHKPTLNGEFGLDGSITSLSTTDPNGIYIHNAIWGTMFGGGMGTGMTWWWDNYIDPSNLYTHFKPLANFTAAIKFIDDNYKKGSATVASTGTSDLGISPGGGFGAASATIFTINGAGEMYPGPTQLGAFLYGSSYNTQYKNPPNFNVNYPVAGQFKVSTGANAGTAPKINIFLDATQVLNLNAAVNTTYSINVPAGNHVIVVDNTGTDWISVSSYIFTNIGSPLGTYILKSADTTKVAGWVLNKNYNWQYVKNSGIPAVVNGATITIPGVQNGTYSVQWADCSTGNIISTTPVVANSNKLIVSCPAIGWDVSLLATRTSVTAVIDLPTARQFNIYPNPVIDGLQIVYTLTKKSKVSFQLYNQLGQKVSTIYQGTQLPGQQSVNWYRKKAALLADGIYFLEVIIGENHHVEKLLLSK